MAQMDGPVAQAFRNRAIKIISSESVAIHEADEASDLDQSTLTSEKRKQRISWDSPIP